MIHPSGIIKSNKSRRDESFCSVGFNPVKEIKYDKSRRDESYYCGGFDQSLKVEYKILPSEIVRSKNPVGMNRFVAPG